ncbi:MAG: hypothetical protein JSV80_14505 [Acidobacteriota bacterium]|nr:MAG: hypothetical protein JSV80_14505 [Acidobacteriota bacterium]
MSHTRPPAHDGGQRASSAPGEPISAAARSLIRAAQGHEFGVQFLLDGFPESVAVIHGVHASVVYEARSYLSTHGYAAHELPQEPPASSDRPSHPDSDAIRGVSPETE